MEPKTARRTRRRNSIAGVPDPKGKWREADRPLESFELFFDDFMLSEIVTWTNQKIENVREEYTIMTGFTFGTKWHGSPSSDRNCVIFRCWKEFQRKCCKGLGHWWYCKANMHRSDEPEALSFSGFFPALWQFHHKRPTKSDWQSNTCSWRLWKICYSMWRKLYVRTWLHSWWKSAWIPRIIWFQAIYPEQAKEIRDQGVCSCWKSIILLGCGDHAQNCIA